MLNFARFLAIVAGLAGFPAIACSTVFSGAAAAGALTDKSSVPPPTGGFIVLGAVFGAPIIASAGALMIGLKAPKWGKKPSVSRCLVFAFLFCLPLVGLNPFGLAPAGLLTVTAILMGVAPAEQYRGVVKVEMAERFESA